MLIYLVFLISFLGIIIGIYLRKIAREEIKYGLYGPGYFLWMRRIIFFLILLLPLFFVDNLVYVLIGIIVGVVLGLFLGDYLLLGISIVTSFLLNINLFFLISSLVFIYGFPFGSSIKINKAKNVGISLIFYSTPFLLLFISLDLNLLIGLVFGWCLTKIIKNGLF